MKGGVWTLSVALGDITTARVVTWIPLRVVEVKVVLGEGLQAALVVSKGVVAPRPGGHHAICRSTQGE